MATHNAAERRAGFRGTMEYAFRNGPKNKNNHEHDINLIEFLGGNTFCLDPIIRDPETGFVLDVNLDDLVEEFEEQAHIHVGKGKMLCGHFMINLAPEDRDLTNVEWLAFAGEYMQAQGYDENTKWIALRHDDCDHSHIHIISCLVKDTVEMSGNPPKDGARDRRTPVRGPLVSTQDSALKGFPVMRKFEKKFGLRELESPDESWGHHYTKGEIKSHGGREEAIKKDKASVIRARFKQLQSEGNGKLPNTMMKLVIALNQKGVEVKISQNEDGSIRGISYRADGDTWLSGSNISSTMATFPALQKKMGVNYNPARDNAFLGVPGAIVPQRIMVDVRITEAQYNRICVKRSRVKVRFNSKKKRVVSLGFVPPHHMQMAITIKNIMNMISALFGAFKGCLGDVPEFYTEEYNDYIYESDSTHEYDMIDDFTAYQALDSDTSDWRTDATDGLVTELALTA